MDLHTQTLLSYPWSIMLPEFTILGVATLLSLLDLFMKDRVDRKIFAWFGIAGIAVALFFVWQNIMRTVDAPVTQILYDSYRVDGYANGFKIIFLVGTALVFLLSLDYVKRKEIAYKGEFYYLILTALLGGMMLASSGDMITMFVGLELLSISSYVLVAIRKKHLGANESAMKYVINGSIATAIMLYGMSFIYGLTGTTNLIEIGMRLNFAFNEGYGLLIYFAFFLLFVGLTFKIAAAPFHMWAPDVYQGAATPVTAFLSVISKAAGFAMIIRLFLVTFLPIASYNVFEQRVDEIFVVNMAIFVAIVAAVTMIIGNTLALRQTNSKRLFAYSSIAQAGYLLVPFAVFLTLEAGTDFRHMLDITLYYLIAYLFMNLGAFAILQQVIKGAGTEDLSAFSGLYHRAPGQAIAMSIFLISLAGLPITAGFFGKFYIFWGALSQGYTWLAVVMVLASVISYYYYFGIIRQMYMRPGATEAPLKLPLGTAIVTVVCVVGTIGLGVLPTPALDFIHEYFNLIDIFKTVEHIVE